jgi:predicted GIY-YIG superfamily endonuclease
LALTVERRIKKLSKAQKEELILRADVFDQLLAEARRGSAYAGGEV